MTARRVIEGHVVAPGGLLRGRVVLDGPRIVAVEGSPMRVPRAYASGLATGTRVSAPRCTVHRPASRSARMRSMARVPQVSLPCTAPSTIRRGPGSRPA